MIDRYARMHHQADPTLARLDAGHPSTPMVPPVEMAAERPTAVQRDRPTATDAAPAGPDPS
ncbi:hypothetical protein [Winogradskya humida]|uniref:hypothetical protein n=1 Tax=Winogradskya humida TaxID=113566 RepID=UPI0019407586|nr:hypothetical protein [Actinoplanes humidus]